MSISKQEAIEKLGCKDKKCEHLNEKGVYTFCTVLFTEEMCLKKKSE